MLAATHRLRRGIDFATTIRGGRRAARGALVVHVELPGSPVSGPLSTGGAAEPVSPGGLGSATDPAERIGSVGGPGGAPSDGPEPAHRATRAGFVVSRAVGGAVTRNLVKRRLRQLVRAQLASLPAGSTLVVRALPAAAVRSYQELGMDLDGALRRALAGRRR